MFYLEEGDDVLDEIVIIILYILEQSIQSTLHSSIASDKNNL